MNIPRKRPWTVEEFFAWQESETERYELVNGFPLRMMVGVQNVHNDIVVNVVAELRGLLRGSDCRPFTGESGIETYPGQIRRPDIGVDCGPRNPNAYKAAAPKLVAEVLSPSTRDFDTFGKLEEYKAVSGLAHILLIEPNAPFVTSWTRGADAHWKEERVEGLEPSVPLTALGVALGMTAIYDGVVFPAGPRLVSGL